MIWLIKAPILVLTLAVWAVVGFVFWVPLLARCTAIFSAGVLLAALARRDAGAYGRQLEIAMSFYADGFRKTVEALTARSSEERDWDFPLAIGRFLAESLWAAIFWIGVLVTAESLGWGGGIVQEAIGRLRFRFGV
jgi:hypothetical protein